MKDKFKKYLEDKIGQYRTKALTARSYKNFDKFIEDKDTNCELATYGDALLKHAFCEILFNEKVENITETKKNYESDKVLVEVVARHYELIGHIRYDRNDKNIPEDYDCETNNNSFPRKYKYIATAVEALIAAIYLDNDKNFGLVVELAKYWKELIDESKN